MRAKKIPKQLLIKLKLDALCHNTLIISHLFYLTLQLRSISLDVFLYFLVFFKRFTLGLITLN
jgi:hypothetical protein